MSSNGSADSAQISILSTVFEEYCRERGIEPYTNAAEDAGRLVMSLYSTGARTPEQLRAGLARARVDTRLSA